MRKSKNFFESFQYAFSGFCYVLKRERNLRFHIWAGTMMFIFAYFFGLSSIEWIALFMTVAFVIVCELINTAIENAVDTATREYSITAKIAKDVAAGAVMVASFFSVCIAAMLFWDIPKILSALHMILGNFVTATWVISVGVLGALFLIFEDIKNKH